MKNNNSFTLIPTLILTSVLIQGCQKNENTTTGNPFVSVAMSSSPANATVAQVDKKVWDLLIPKSFAYPPPALLLDAAGNSVTINAIWANFGQLEFKFNETASGSEIDGVSIEFSTPKSVNLLANNPQPFVQGQINISQMRRVKLKLTKTTALPTGAPSGFLGKSIYISGTIKGHAFTYSTQDETVIEIAGPTLLTAVENRTLLIELQIANLIKKTNFSNITTPTDINDGNRVLTTNPCANIESGAADLFTCFYKGFARESNLGRDDDGDFTLDPNEESVKP